MVSSSSDGDSYSASLHEGERKFGVALFADLSGYTALCQRLDPEDVERAVRPLMRSLRNAVADQAGSVMSIAGDGFFAMFGVPQSLPDAPTRALQAAMNMRSLVASQNAAPGTPDVPDVHVGIAAGEVLVTPGDDPGGLSLVGRSINLASRLCDAAGPGEVLVDAVTRELVGTSVTWSAPRELSVQGHPELVLAWQPENQEPPAVNSLRDPTFVGRDDALEGLDGIAREVERANTSRVVTLIGDAGIGKSRLVREWLERRGHDACWFSCSQDGTRQSALDLLHTLPGAPQDDADIEKLLRQPPGLPRASGQRPDPSSAVLAALRRRLAGVPHEGRLFVCVIDNFEDADVSLVTAVSALGQRPVDTSVLLVAAQRTSTSVENSNHRLVLDPLGSGEIAMITAEVLAADPKPRLSATLVDRAQGNPLMAMHSAAFLRSSDSLSFAEGRCDLADPSVATRLPASLRLFIDARIDALGAPAKSLLRALSTFAEPIATDDIKQVLGAQAPAGLEALAGTGLLSACGANRFQFGHKLIREVAYASLTRRSRAELHHRQLDVLSTRAPESVRAYHAVAWHEAIGSGGPDARPAAVAALRESLGHAEATNRGSAAAARAVIARVRDILDDHAETAPQVAAQLLTLDARCLLDLGDFEDSLRAAARARALAGQSASVREEFNALLAEGAALSRLQRYEAARQALDAAANVAEQLGDLSAKARSLWMLGETWRHSARHRFAELTEAAFDLYQEAGDADGAAECARLLAYLLSPVSVLLYERWAGIASRATAAEDVRGRAWVARAAAFAATYRLDMATAGSSARAAIDLGSSIGALDIEVDGRIALLLANVALGELTQARTAADELIAAATRTANPRMRAAVASQAAVTFLRSGDPLRCEEELTIARSVLNDLGVVEAEALAAAEGAVTGLRGHWDAALSNFEDDARSAAEGGLFLLRLLAQIDRARICVEVREIDDDLTSLVTECEQAGAANVTSFARALLDRGLLRSDISQPPSVPATGAGLEERAFRADTAALRLETTGERAEQQWNESRDLWQRLGLSVWLARAQARCGDLEAAKHTLDVLDSPAEARDWALGGPTRT